MNLPTEKFVQKAKCANCSHAIAAHRPTNGDGFECKALDAAGSKCGCVAPTIYSTSNTPAIWSK